MFDVLFLAPAVGGFALIGAYLTFCERVGGSDAGPRLGRARATPTL